MGGGIRLLGVQIDEEPDALKVVLELDGVKSMADVGLSVGALQIELQTGAAPALTIPLPKLVDPGVADAAKFSKKTGLLKMSLRLA